jgi:hypothetical protein
MLISGPYKSDIEPKYMIPFYNVPQLNRRTLLTENKHKYKKFRLTKIHVAYQL